MSTITVSGGGSTAVATDDLLTAADQLTALSREAMLLGAEVTEIARRFADLGEADSPAVARAAGDVSQAVIVLGQLEVEARTLSVGLTSSAEGYAWVERMLGGELGAMFGLGGAVAGRLGPGAGVLSTAALAGAGTVAGGDDGLAGFLQTPAGVELLRALVMSGDEAVLGAAGVPPALAMLLGSGGIGAVGLGTVAGLIGRGGRVTGALPETPVRVVGATPLPTRELPQGIAARLAAIPDPGRAPGALGGDQVRVDVWEQPDGTRVAEAYVAGTVTFDLRAQGEPFDMSGNVAALAGTDGASVRAVEAALRAAGVDAATPVQLFGYSQGGAVAAQLAASGDWNVAGLGTFGGPTGQIPIPPDIPTMLIENTDDPVPAFGGDQDNRAALRITHRAFDDDAPRPPVPLPPHDRSAYARTADLVDAATSERVRDAVATFDRFTAGATLISSTSFEIDRIAPEGSALEAGELTASGRTSAGLSASGSRSR